jgi:GNAT superfamily N-acetyltransferase
MELETCEADFSDPVHCAGIVEVLDSYAKDPVGGGAPLSPDARARLVPALRDHPTALVLLAFADRRPVGVAVCFFGLSTFQARPLLNIHDLAVVPESRGRGVGRALLELYESFGFGDFVVGDSAPTRFLAKPLDPPARSRAAGTG